MFQSSPVANDGCNTMLPVTLTQFQSSPVANDGCNVLIRLTSLCFLAFQSSPVANDGCNTARNQLLPSRERSFNPHPSRTTGATPRRLRNGRTAGGVSILTRRERRVQPPQQLRAFEASLFQSSPVANDGCNFTTISAVGEHLMFQSSPVANDGCNPQSPSRSHSLPMFQSSPVANDGCNRSGPVALP